MDFPAALNAFIAALDAAGAKQNATMPNLPNYYKPFTVEAGSKYLRIVCTSGGSRSVHCFVRKEDGAVLKAASFRIPAKGERANIFKPETYEGKIDVHTGWLYR